MKDFYPPVIALLHLSLPYSVDSEESDYDIGFTMFRKHEELTHKPVRYWSRSLKDAEGNYSTP